MNLHLELQHSSSGRLSQRAFTKPTISVGRDPNCDLAMLSDPSDERVSWQHAVLELRDSGLFIRDLDSKNGTYLNEQPVREHVLRVGDCVRLARKGPRLRILDFQLPMRGEIGRIGCVPKPLAERDWDTPEECCRKDVSPKRDEVVANAPPRFSSAGRFSSTRQLLLRNIKNQKQAWLVAIAVSVLAFLGGVLAIMRSGGADPVGKAVHGQVLYSTVLVFQPDTATVGTGALIDEQRRLIVTNFHVVRGADTVEVYVPLFGKDGNLISEQSAYDEEIKESRGRPAKVLVRDESSDLAILQVESLWDNARPLRLAEKSCHTGERVHSLGNPSVSGAYWVYTSGTVRQVFDHKWKAGTPGQEFEFHSQVVETQSPVNPGDSGGPLVNDRCELVGVTHGFLPQGQLVSLFIDVTAVRGLLSRVP